ncbi:transmembrane-type terpene cyclase [Streptomyces avidinii]
MDLFLTLVSGVAWTVVYVEAIRVGLRDRTYAMPVAALALNFAWESTYAVNEFRSGVSAQGVVNVVWALADIVIVYTYLRYGRAELPRFVTRPMFALWSGLVFASAFAVQWLFLAHFGPHDASRYSAFLQNLLMSGLFVALYASRRGRHGQSLVIAVAKWVGTLAPTVLFGIVEDAPLVLGLGLLCAVFDLAYVALLAVDPAATAADGPGVAGGAGGADRAGRAGSPSGDDAAGGDVAGRGARPGLRSPSGPSR